MSGEYTDSRESDEKVTSKFNFLDHGLGVEYSLGFDLNWVSVCFSP